MFKIPEEVTNKYQFVTLAAKRAEQLQMGALPKVESGSEKVTVIAQEEVATGRVAAYDPELAEEEFEMEEEE
jgi:DNA-directed RNA polymerase omega subunit